MRTTRRIVLGSELKVGDRIIPWYERIGTIIAIHPYNGKLAYLFPKGASIISMTGSFEASMTVDHNDTYTLVEEK